VDIEATLSNTDAVIRTAKMGADHLTVPITGNKHSTHQ
jgi:hypothetical protein